MNHKKAKRKADDVRRKDMKHMAEDAPDSNAVKWFRRPVAYQAGRLIRAQIGADKVKWGDLVDYMIQGVTDGSIRLSDPIPGDGHINVADYISKIGGDTSGQEET